MQRASASDETNAIASEFDAYRAQQTEVVASLRARVAELQSEMAAAAAAGGQYRLTVDLKACTVSDDAGFSRSFTVDPFRRQCLLEGLDDIALSLRHTDEVAAWEAVHGLPAVSG